MKTYLYIGLLLWLVLFATSFALLFFSGAELIGLDKGLKQVTYFIGMQFFAFLVSLPIWWNGRKFRKATLMRWLTRIPLLSTFTLIVFIVATLGYMSIFADRPSQATDKPRLPVTQIPTK